MIEQAMIFALGACVAGLVALLILPAISRRASRLARADVERQMPLSAHEIVAQRDLLRAEFAAERRRLEQAHESVAEAHAKTRADLGRRAVEVGQLTAALTETSAARDAAQIARDEAARRMHAAEAENATFQKALYDADGLESRLRENVAVLGRDKNALERGVAERDIALTALEARRAEHAAKADEFERTLMQARLDLSLARTRVETQGAQIDGFEDRARLAAAKESELRHRIAELEQAGAQEGDLAMLRRTIVEIGREVVRLAAETSKDTGKRVTAPRSEAVN